MTGTGPINHMSLFIKDLVESIPLLSTGIKVSVVGVAVDVINPDYDLHPNRPLTVSLDDGTGVIKCVLFRHREQPHLADIKIGDCFLARGLVGQYFEQTQIKCDVLKVVDDPNFETFWVNKVLVEKKMRK